MPLALRAAHKAYRARTRVSNTEFLMSNYVCAVLLWVTSAIAYAQDREIADAPVEKADPIVLVLFFAIFFGMIVYYGWKIWYKGRREGDE